jgi:hypothetical protein
VFEQGEGRYPFRNHWYKQVPNVHRWLSGDRSEAFSREYPHADFEVDFWFAQLHLMRAILGWAETA